MVGKKNRKPTQLKALDLLTHFQTVLTKEQVTFTRFVKPERLLTPVEELITLFGTAEENKNNALTNARVNLADFLDWHEVHKQGQDLWRELLSAAIRSIDDGAKGHSELLNYLKAATEFEDLLYGLEPFYRDHTLHSLWVYLIGVKLMGKRGKLGEIGRQVNWYVYNDIQEGERPEELVQWAHFFEKDHLNKVIQKKRDALWCIIALCHDLGYSLAKLPDLNKKVEAVLKFYDVPDFRHVGYVLDMEHQYLVKQFLELMAMDVRITPGNDYPEDAKNSNEKGLCACIRAVRRRHRNLLSKSQDLDLGELRKGGALDLRKLLMRAVTDRKMDEPARKQIEDLAGKVYENVLTKCYRDDSSYWRLCKALERKEHGILSAYLLYKTVGLFADTSVRPPAEGWGLDDDEAVDNIIRGDILFAIAQHEFAYAHINQMSSLAEILILCDELEEFSRLGRQLQSRKYHDTTAETAVDIHMWRSGGGREPNNTEVGITMTYHSQHKTLVEFAQFCLRKARRFSRLFSLGPGKKSRDEEAYRIREIETILDYGEKCGDGESGPDCVIVFTMKQNGAITIARRGANPVGLESRNDDLYRTDKQQGSLGKWLRSALGIKIKDWPEAE